MSARKEVRELIDAALEQGWRVRETGGNHYQLLAPDQQHIVTLPSTPSDWRALQNCRSITRKAGFRD